MFLQIASNLILKKKYSLDEMEDSMIKTSKTAKISKISFLVEMQWCCFLFHCFLT